MIHELFDKQPPVRRVSSVSTEAGAGLFDNLDSFGWLRNERDRAVMLEVRRADGEIMAFSYAWMETAKFNPSHGITLNFSGTSVTLIGRNLNSEVRPAIRLFEGLVRHRVVWLQEADETTIAESSETDVVIEAVKIE